MKSDGTAKYTVTLAVTKPNLKTASVTPGGTWHGGTVSWTGGCKTVNGVVCKLADVPNAKKLYLKYDAPKVTKNTPVTLTLKITGTGADKKPLDAVTKTIDLLVKKPAPTKTTTPTKSSKPTASHKPSHAPAPAPSGHGQVPVPLSTPTDLPSSFPSAPGGPLPPLPNGTPTSLPRLPSVAPSPEASPRVPNVAEPPRKASGEVRTDAVSLPAAAAAAFIGLGAGTVITRSVRRRGLMRTIGRHRD